jgi:multisubunit Na+/H+ antiporter MnhB subunit
MDRPLCTAPGASRGLFDVTCPLAVPRDIGMSVLLTSPAYLLAIPAFLDRDPRRRRIALAAGLAVLLVSLANLMHFSQGWVQFGYRFANDTVPFALVLVALGFARLVEPDRGRIRRWAMPVAIGLVVVSIAANAWGVIWGRILGW